MLMITKVVKLNMDLCRYSKKQLKALKIIVNIFLQMSIEFKFKI